MMRPTRERVDAALEGVQFDGRSYREMARTLAAEVLALRQELADLESRALAALEQMTVDATTAITGAGIHADLAEQYAVLRVTIARIEALPLKWLDDVAYQRESVADCAADVERVLRGRP